MRFAHRSLVNTTLALLVILALCLALVVSLRGAAHAAGTSIQLWRKSGPPTTVLTVKGVGYGANEVVAIDFHGQQVSTTTSSPTGTFSTSIAIPASALPGVYEVQAAGQSSGLSAQSAFRVQTNRSMFGFNRQHSHFNPFENVVTSANVQGLTLNWSYPTGGGIGSSPAGVNGVVYFGSVDGNLYALDATTGSLNWSYFTGGGASSPAVANGVVYIGSGDAKLYAFHLPSTIA